jgi:hypothetical protein
MILVMDIPALQKLKFDAIENDAWHSPHESLGLPLRAISAEPWQG